MKQKFIFIWKKSREINLRFPWKHDFIKMNFVKKRFREITISVQSHYCERGKNHEIIFSVKSLTFLSCWLNREFPEKGNCRLSSSKIKMSCLSWSSWSKRFHSITPCTSSINFDFVVPAIEKKFVKSREIQIFFVKSVLITQLWKKPEKFRVNEICSKIY